ncbi:MAG: hypothetical protein V4550_19595 [Gemmatimonadota bacterium]
MFRRFAPLVLCAAALFGCEKIDKVLEGPQPIIAKVAVGVASPLNLSQGSEQTVSATITRIGAFTAEAALTVEGVPDGVTATVGPPATSGLITTTPVSLRASADTKLGTYLLTLRARGTGVSDATTPLVLNIVEVPAIQLTASKTSLAVIRGGVAPFVVNVARTNYTSPVSVSLQGPAGISLSMDGNPFTGDQAQAMLAIAPEVAAGTYSATLRATAAGLSEKTLPLSVNVSNDPFQVLVGSDIVATQASVATRTLVINRAGYSASVLLTLEGLPVGATAAFDAPSTTGASSVMTVTIGATVPEGAYNLVLRGRGAGVPDVTTPVLLTVKPAAFSIAVAPQSFTLTPGATASATISVVRSGYDGVLTLSAQGAPAGLTVSASPASLSISTATLNITTASNVAAGTYDVALRATPVGVPVSAAPAAIVTITIKPVAVGNGNVVLDWSACTPPAWVASSDGTGPWTQQIPVGGKAQFTMASARGAIAFVEGGVTTVRYMTLPELASGPINMCPQLPGPKTVVGTTIHSTSATELYTYLLGGGTATSSAALPNFTISGVRDGPQDFIAFGTSTFSFTLRGLIRRDVNLPNGGSLGLLNMDGPESFPLARMPFTMVVAGGGTETYTHTMSYLTTPACIVNPLATVTATALTTGADGIPAAFQRPSDFHLLTARGITATRTRTTSQAFHSLSLSSIALPAVIVAPTVTVLAGSYKRVQASFGILAAEYNGLTTLSYNDGSKVMNVTATKAYTGTQTFTIAMPDMSAATGWSSAYAIPATTAVSWSYTLEGASSAESACAEGRRTVTLRQTGGI